MAAHDYDRQLNAERLAFHAARQQFDTALKPAGSRVDTIPLLLETAEEFGVDEALKRFAANPKTYEVRMAPGGKEVRAALAALAASNERMDRIVSAREDHLAKADPGRPRAYVSMGREFTLDEAKGLIRYLDDGTTAPLSMKAVEPGRTHKLDKTRDGKSRRPDDRNR